MKQILLSGLIGLIALAGCKDDDNVIPNELVVQAFNTKYPTASRVEWEPKNTYLTAEFIDEQLSHTAWFSTNGQWYMTETELNNLNLLPEKVVSAFKNSEYATWHTDDIDRLEREGVETLYVIEVKQGNQELDLYYSQEGLLIKTVKDDHNDDYENELPSQIPSALTTFIDTQYPGARIIDTDIEARGTEIEIIHNNRKKEVLFNTKNEWISTHYDVAKTEVDSNVIQALNNSAYAAYTIDDIEKYETPAENYYYFELEQGNTEMDIKIDMNGTITQAKH